jgi:hypothetical protein
MNFEEFCHQTDEIATKSRETDDPESKEALKDAFFDAAIDFFNENLTGDVRLADGRTVFIPAIENP